MHMRFTSALGLALGLMLSGAPVHAQPATARAIRVVVPFPAGGPTDAVARTVLQAAATRSGGPGFVIDNKPGAEGAIAAQSVTTAPPDGNMLLVATSGVMALPAVTKPAPFDASELVPVATFGRFAFGVFVHPDVPARTVQELIALARSKPGQLNVAAANLSEHTSALQFMKATGTQMLRVPYKGAAQALPDLIAGRVQVYITPLTAGLPAVRDGKLRLLAVAVPARHPLTPDVPTLAEQGVQGVSVPSYQFLMAPARTPREVIDRLARDIAAALADPAVRAQLEQRGLTFEPAPAGGLAALLSQGALDYAAAARETGALQ